MAHGVVIGVVCGDVSGVAIGVSGVTCDVGGVCVWFAWYAGLNSGVLACECVRRVVLAAPFLMASMRSVVLWLLTPVLSVVRCGLDMDRVLGVLALACSLPHRPLVVLVHGHLKTQPHWRSIEVLRPELGLRDGDPSRGVIASICSVSPRSLLALPCGVVALLRTSGPFSCLAAGFGLDLLLDLGHP